MSLRDLVLSSDPKRALQELIMQWRELVSTLNESHGIYTPVLTNVTNVSASTAYACQWMQVGDVVTVSGRVDVDPITTATSTQVGISLPRTSNFANIQDCAGVAAASAIAGQSAAILADTTNNRAQMQWISGDVANQAMYFTLTYRVI